MRFLPIKIVTIFIISLLNIETGYSQDIDQSLLDFFKHVPENAKENFSFLLPDHIIEFLQNGDDRSLGKVVESSKFTFSRNLAYAAKARVVGDIDESNRYLQNIINDYDKNKNLTLSVLLSQAMLAGNYIQQNKIKMWVSLSQEIYEETNVINKIIGGKSINFGQLLPANFFVSYENVYNTYLEGIKETVLDIKNIKGDDHIFFDIYVNNDKETSILDTGLYISFFPERFLNRSDVHIIGKSKISDVFGNIKESYLAQVDSITIGNVRVKNLLVQISKGINNIIVGENLLRLLKTIKIDSKNIYLNRSNISCQYNLLEGSTLNGIYSSPRISSYIDHVFYNDIIFDLGMAFDKHTSLLDNNITPIVFIFGKKEFTKQGKNVKYDTFLEKNIDVIEYRSKNDLILQKNFFGNIGSIYVNKNGGKDYIFINRDMLKLANINIDYRNKKICFINKK